MDQGRWGRSSWQSTHKRKCQFEKMVQSVNLVFHPQNRCGRTGRIRLDSGYASKQTPRSSRRCNRTAVYSTVWPRLEELRGMRVKHGQRAVDLGSCNVRASLANRSYRFSKSGCWGPCHCCTAAKIDQRLVFVFPEIICQRCTTNLALRASPPRAQARTHTILLSLPSIPRRHSSDNDSQGVRLP